MPSKPKSSRYEYLSKTISAIFKLKKTGQLHNKLTHQSKILEFFVTIIIYKKARQ